jgi:hypothetical protein
MASLLDIIDKKGRISYTVLKEFISNTALTEFTEQSPNPFLIGKELYDGELHKKIGDQSSGTMKFQVSDIKEIIGKTQKDIKRPEQEIPAAAPDTTSISHAIYCLRKKSTTMIFNKPVDNEEQNTFNIGRADDNDIVIADYSISKHHSQILLYRDMYFAVDLRSTNGTKVNQHPISSGMKVQLQIGSTVSFGRFCFIFTHPLQLYRGMRREILGM